MKKTSKLHALLIIAVTFCISPVFCLSQTTCRYNSTITSTVTQTYDPSIRVAGKTTLHPGMPFEVDFSTSSVDLNVLNRIFDALGKWSNVLATSDASGALKTVIQIEFANLGTGDLMITETNFQYDFSSLAFGNTLYPQALANFIKCKEGASGRKFGSTYDVKITINNNAAIPWNYDVSGACPPTKVDFLTCFLHEMAHGLGFSGKVTMSGSNVILDGDKPSIYDKYVDDNGTGATSGCTSSPVTAMADLWAVGAGILPFQSYVKGQGGYKGSCSASSNNLYITPSTTLPIFSLYTPSTWDEGSSIYHCDGTTGTQLMRYAQSNGERRTITTETVQVLDGIGWDVLTTIGISDHVEIKNSACTGTPPQVFTLGTVNNYCLYSTTAMAYGTGEWKLKLYADDGLIEVASQSGYSVWNVTLSSLPSGHTWTRDINNRVMGILTYRGQDMGGYWHTNAIAVGVNYTPQAIAISGTGTGSFLICDKYTVKFYAPGATSYNVMYRTNTGTWGAWTTASSPTAGACSYDFTGLNEYQSYQFKVEAVNSYGTITSAVASRNRCRYIITSAPNTFENTIHVSVNYEEDGPPILLTGIDVTSVQNQNINIHFQFNGTSSTVDIDLSEYNLPSGVYVLTAHDTEGNTSSTEIQTSY